MQELDFVAANLVMAIIADFMLVWLPAPTLSYAAGAAKAGNPLNIFSRMFAGCPDNAFQKVQPGMPGFTLMQRLGAPVRNGLKLFAVGLGASMIGVGITNALIGLRQMLDPTFVPLNQAQDVVNTSLAYGAYMATSSNIRCVRFELGVGWQLYGGWLCGSLLPVDAALLSWVGLGALQQGMCPSQSSEI